MSACVLAIWISVLPAGVCAAAKYGQRRLLSSNNIFQKGLAGGLAAAAKGLLRALPVLVLIFLLLVAGVNYLGELGSALPEPVSRLIDGLSNFSAVFMGIFVEAAPFLLLGTLASGIVEVFINREDLVRWIPRHPLLGALVGSLFGLFFPVCECGVVPFTRRLIYKGVPVSVGIATLLAAPVLNPIVIASTFAAFGPGLVFFGRLGLSLVIATLTGLVFAMQPDANALLKQPVRQEDLVVRLPATPLPIKNRLRQVMVVAADEFFEMGRYLVLGALLAALMQTFVRQAALLEVGQGPLLSVLVMVVVAVLLSVCSTVDAFIALAFAGTFTAGSVLAFLVYGPMVDIKSTLMFLRVFRPRTVAYLVLLPLMLTLVFTVMINYLFQGGGF